MDLGSLSEPTVGHLVMASGPWLRDGCQLGVGVNVAGAGAVLKLTQVVFHSLQRFVVPIGLEQARVTATTARAIGGELPRGLVRVGSVTAGAYGSATVVARVLGGCVHESSRRPGRIAVAGRAVQRSRHVAGGPAAGGGAVVATLAVADDSSVIEAGWSPGKRAVAVAALLCGCEMIARHGGGANSNVTAAAGGSSGDEICVFHPLRSERYRRVAGIAVVVARDVVRSLAHRGGSVVAAETAASGRRVIHAYHRSERIERMTQLTVVLRRNVGRRPRDRIHPRANRVTAGAIAGGASEYPLKMAVFTRQISMSALELVTGRQVVELRALHGRSVRQAKHEQDEHCE